MTTIPTVSEVAAIMAKAERNCKRYQLIAQVAVIAATIALAAVIVAGIPRGWFHLCATVMVWAYVSTLAERIRILECLAILQGRR